MTEPLPVVVVGAGIGGLVAALSLHAVGADVDVYESAEEVRPLGVGINLLPHAVRELDALGLLDALLPEAVTPGRLAYFSRHGQAIWDEPRGLAAGYRWPQLSIHRGTLQRILLQAAIERLGAARIHTGHQLLSFDGDEPAQAGHASAVFRDRRTGGDVRVACRALIAADGIHSAARQQLHPHQGMPIWNGAQLWRGAVEHEPILDGRTLVWAGSPRQKFVGYPILDLPNGNQLFNFIAELRFDDRELAQREDWNRPGELSDYLPAFESWVFDWLDVPALLRRAPGTFVFPMVDRDPLDRWTHGRMTLLGDAAHPMYPVGSNGASQAILDAATLAGCFRCHPGDVALALQRYDDVRRPATGAIVLANRGLGPELPMQIVEERAPDGFADIADVISPDEILAVTEGYRRTAGFALEALADGTSLAERSY
jgi:2-polyprenyl-6-methoxyphenol hydroxylase-like FAD-dependent oxidoreductase